jgi:hypothetical protein
MRKFIITVAVISSMILFHCFGLTATVNANPLTGVTITEVMPDPLGKDEDLEWLELFNPGNNPVVLKDWTINAKPLPESTVQANSYLILANNPTALIAQLALTIPVQPFKTALINSGGELTLRDPSLKTIQVFSYGQAHEDVSFELLQGGCGTIQMNPSGNSIGLPNHQCNAVTPTPAVTTISGKLTPINVIIALVCPDPEGTGEYLELENLGSEPISLNNWQLQDLSGNIQKIASQVIAPQSRIKFAAKGITLNNTGDTVYLFDDQARQIDVMFYPDKLGHQCYPVFPAPVVTVTPQTVIPQCPPVTLQNTINGKPDTATRISRYAIPKLYQDQGF